MNVSNRSYDILLYIVLSFISVGLYSCIHSNAKEGQNSTTNIQNDLGIGFKKAFDGLKFKRPLDLQAMPGSNDWLFIVEQQGKIWAIKNGDSPFEKKLVLDISSKVDDNTNEEGLLGLAFHPEFQNNGYLYVNYTVDRPHQSRISRFRIKRSELPAVDRESEEILMTYQQPYWNHNGGGLAFGPDGLLYIGVGDGGSGGDPRGHGQNRKSLLGSILRIDVNQGEEGKLYSIPVDNPFKANREGFREEIYAYGLRNPWRISFDPLNGTLWTGDVGQNAYEEVDTIVNGGNYGWKLMEGDHCFKRKNCNSDQLIGPVWEYGRGDGFSITGGYVYRGDQVQLLNGKYIYGDFVSHKIWALDYSDPDQLQNILIADDRQLQVSSFGVDHEGELYLCSFNGHIYKMEGS